MLRNSAWITLAVTAMLVLVARGHSLDALAAVPYGSSVGSPLLTDTSVSGKLAPCSTVSYTVFANTTSVGEYLQVDLTLGEIVVEPDTMTIEVVRIVGPGAGVQPDLVIPPCTVASGATTCGPLVVACQYAATNGSYYVVTLTTSPGGTKEVSYTVATTVGTVVYTGLELEKATTATPVVPNTSKLETTYMYFDVEVADSAPKAGSRVTFDVVQSELGQLTTSGTFINHDAIPCAEGMDCSLPVAFVDGCSFEADLECSVYADECSVAALGGGVYTLALTVNKASGTYTVTPNVTLPEARKLVSGVSVADGLAVTDRAAYYYLDVGSAVAGSVLTIAVTQIENGKVNVGQAHEVLPFEACAEHGGVDPSLVCEGATANCHVDTQGCDLLGGRYYFAVEATQLPVPNRKATYVITATIAPRPAPLALASEAAPVAQTVRATGNAFYALPHVAGQWMNVHVYVDATADYPGLTLYLNPHSVAGAGPGSSLCYDHVQSCTVTPSTNPGCTLQVSPCDLGPASVPWFATVVGAAGNFYGNPIQYTIDYEILFPIVLSPGYVKAQSYQVKAGIYDHFVIDEPWLGRDVIVVINATLSSVEYYVNYGDLAGACPCYDSVVSGSLTAPGSGGSQRDSAVVPLSNCGPAPGWGKIYVGVRGTSLSKQYSKYIVSYIVRDQYVPVPLSPVVNHQLALPASAPADTVEYFSAALPPPNAFLTVQITGAFGSVGVLVDDANAPLCRPSVSVGTCSPATGFGAACLVVVPPCELASTSAVVLTTSGTEYSPYALSYFYTVPQVVGLASGVSVASVVKYGVPSRYSIAVPAAPFSSLVVELYIDAGQSLSPSDTASLLLSRGSVPGDPPCYDAEHECTTASRCIITLDPCDLVAGIHYITVTSSVNQANIRDLSFTLKATVAQAVYTLTDNALPLALTLFESQVVYATYATRDVSATAGTIYDVELGNVRDGTVTAHVFYGLPPTDCECLVYTDTATVSSPYDFANFEVDYCQVGPSSTVTVRLEATSVASSSATRSLGLTLSLSEATHTVTPLVLGKASDTFPLANRQTAMFKVSPPPTLPERMASALASARLAASHVAASPPPPAPAPVVVTTVTVDNVSPYYEGDVDVYLNFDMPAADQCSSLHLCSGAANCSVQVPPCDLVGVAADSIYVSVRATTAHNNDVDLTVRVDQDEVRELSTSSSVQVTLQAPRSTVVSVAPALVTNGAYHVGISSVTGGSAVVELVPSLCIATALPTCAVSSGATCALSASGCLATMSPETADTWYVRVRATSGSPALTLQLDNPTVTATHLTAETASTGTLAAASWASFVISAPAQLDVGTMRLVFDVSTTTSGGVLDVYLNADVMAFDFACHLNNCTASSASACSVGIGACCLRAGTNYFVSVYNPSQDPTSGSVDYSVVAHITPSASTPQSLALSSSPSIGSLAGDYYAEYSFDIDGSGAYGDSLLVVVNSTSYLASDFTAYVAKGTLAGDGAIVAPTSPPSCFTSFAGCTTASPVCVLQFYAGCIDASAPLLSAGTYFLGVRAAAPTPTPPPPTPNSFLVAVDTQNVETIELGKASTAQTVATQVNAQFVAVLPAPDSSYGLELDVAVTSGSVSVFVSVGATWSVGPPAADGTGVKLAGSSTVSPCLTSSPSGGTPCSSAAACTITVAERYCQALVVRIGVVGTSTAPAAFSLTLSKTGSSGSLVSGTATTLAAAGGSAFYTMPAASELSYMVVTLAGVGASDTASAQVAADGACMGATPAFPTLSCTGASGGASCTQVFTVSDVEDWATYTFETSSSAVAAPAAPPTIEATVVGLPMVELAADGSIHELELEVYTAVTYVLRPANGYVAPGQSLDLVVAAPLCGSMSVYVGVGRVAGSLTAAQTCTGGCNVTLADACDVMDEGATGTAYYVTVVGESTNFASFGSPIPIRFSIQVVAGGAPTVYEQIVFGSGAPALFETGVPASYSLGLASKVLGNFESVVVELRMAEAAVNSTVLEVDVGKPVHGCSSSPKTCTVAPGATKCAVSYTVCELQGGSTKLQSLFMTTHAVGWGVEQLALGSVWVLPDYGFVQGIAKGGNYSGVIYSSSVETYAVPLDGPLAAKARFRLSLDLYTFGYVSALGLAVGPQPTPQCGASPPQWPSGITVDYCQIGEYQSVFPDSADLFASVVANSPATAELVPYVVEASFEPPVMMFGAGPECFTMVDAGIMFFQSTLATGAVRFEANVSSAVDGLDLYVNLERLASPACNSATCGVAEGSGWDGYSCVASPTCPALNPLTSGGVPVFLTVTGTPGSKYVLSSKTERVPVVDARVAGLTPAADPLQVSGVGSVDTYYKVALPATVRAKSSVMVLWSEGLDELLYSASPFPTNEDQCGIAEDVTDATTCVGAGLTRKCYAVLPCDWGTTFVYVHAKLDAPVTTWPWSDNFTAPWSFNVSVVEYTADGAWVELDAGTPVSGTVAPGELGVYKMVVDEKSGLAVASSKINFVWTGVNAGSFWTDVYEYAVDGNSVQDLCWSVVDEGAMVVSGTGGTSTNATVPTCRTHAASYYVFMLGLTTGQPVATEGSCVEAAYQLQAVVESTLPGTFVPLGLGNEVEVKLGVGEVAGFEVAYDRAAVGGVATQAVVVSVHALKSGTLSGKVERYSSFLPEYELCKIELEGDNMATVIPGCVVHAGKTDASSLFVSLVGTGAGLPYEYAQANVSVSAAAYKVISPGVTYKGSLGTEAGNPKWVDTDLYQVTLPGGASTGVVINVGPGGSKVKVEVRYGSCAFAGGRDEDAGSTYMQTLTEMECYSGECVFSFDHKHATVTADSDTPTPYNLLVRGSNTNYTLTVGVGRGNCAMQPSAFCPGSSFSWRWSNASAQDNGAELLFNKLYCKYRECDSECPREVTAACNATLKAFACATTFPDCDGAGLLTPPCQSLCSRVTNVCGLSFAEVGLVQYDCFHNYFEQTGPCTGGGASSSKSGLSAGLIVLIVLAVLIVVALIVGAVVMIAKKSGGEGRGGYTAVPSDESGAAAAPAPVAAAEPAAAPSPAPPVSPLPTTVADLSKSTELKNSV